MIYSIPMVSEASKNKTRAVIIHLIIVFFCTFTNGDDPSNFELANKTEALFSKK